MVFGSSIPYDDPRLNLSGCKLVRADNKKGGIGIYFKEILAVRLVPINRLKESL